MNSPTAPEFRHLVAASLGMLAGFLLNRARGGTDGMPLLYEMLLGALVVTLICLALSRVNRLAAERRSSARLNARLLHETEQMRRLALLEAEAERYRAERLLREQALRSIQQTASLQHELQRATERITALEAIGPSPQEAAERLQAIEEAQQSLRRESIEISRLALKDAEEAKASLRMLISDSQRQRNTQAPENDQSARIIELESRIQRLARELERLSVREAAINPAVAPPGAPDRATQARTGFLKAMLDANVTLRRQIQDAA